MNKITKNGILVLLLLLAIGFAAVTTNLIANGTARLGSTSINGLVYFSSASTDEGGSAERALNNTQINFTTKELKVVGDTATLNYTVYNDSSQYDADVTMTVVLTDSSTVNEYVSISYTGFQPAEQGNNHAVRINGKESANGTIVIELDKLALSDLELEFTITLDVVAVERTSEATTQPAPVDICGNTYSGLGHNYNYNSCNHNSDGELVYFDPVTENECSKNTFSVSAINAGTSTCYAWRIINNCDGDYVMQLDHSLSYSLWNNASDEAAAMAAKGDETSAGTNVYGPISALKELERSTCSWTRVDPINYTYTNNVEIATGGRGGADVPLTEGSYGTLNCTQGACSVTYNPSYQFTTNLRARLITYEDVRAIYGNNNPTKFGSYYENYNDVLIISSSGYSNNKYNVGKSLWWLFENALSSGESTSTITGATPNQYNITRPNGMDSSSNYWTLSPGIKTPGIVGDTQVGYTEYVLGMDPDFDLDYWGGAREVGVASFHWTIAGAGLRPVISVPTSQVRFDSEA